MTEEQVVHAAECHLNDMDCEHCEYFDISKSCCVDNLIEELRDIVIAKLPRPLSYKEVEQICEIGEDCIWCEAKNVGFYVSRWLRPFAYTQYKIVCDTLGNTIYVDLFKEDYGKLWRAWKVRPTLGESSAIKW